MICSSWLIAEYTLTIAAVNDAGKRIASQYQIYQAFTEIT